jgi:high-affinity iron transporter
VIWSDAVPNFVIGLREGLEAGLIVSILLAAVKRSGASAIPVWLGALGAASLSASFAMVLTYTTSELSATAQEVVAGGLSVIAVALVTVMIFWMRRTAAGLSKQLRGGVEHALAIGAGALVLTAFFSVAREGLETTLFLWTAARTTGDTVGPAVGAAIGLLVAFGLCVLLYRQALRINLGVFFSRTAVLLVVVAAGVLSYGLGDLQNAGLLPGRSWVAFDLSAHVGDSWWVALITGITNLTPKMTVLQVFAWLVYLAVVLFLFLRPAAPTAFDPADKGRFEAWAERQAGRRALPVGAAIIAVPLLVAGLVVALLPAKPPAAQAMTVTAADCGKGFDGAVAGRLRIAVTNKSGKSGEINLVNAAGAVVGEIETIGPATTADLTATLGNGSYKFNCYLAGQSATSSAPFTVSGADGAGARAVHRVTKDDLVPPNVRYQDYVRAQTAKVVDALAPVRAALAAGDPAGARTAYLPALLSWEKVGASYNSFGDLGKKAAGLPDGFAGGVHDPDFSGLRRLEYGLYHGDTAATLLPVVDGTVEVLHQIAAKVDTDDIAGDPTALTLRAHEILEDALRDHLTGVSDLGAHAGFAATAADVEVTRYVVGLFAPLLDDRDPTLVSTIGRELDAVDAALSGLRAADGTYPALDAAPTAARQQVNGIVGAALETLSAIPNLLEVPKHEN